MTHVFTDSPNIRSVSNITSAPTITIHPASQLVTAHMNFTLNCEGTGEGSITYQWETMTGYGGKWTIINNSNSTRFVISNLSKPQQYRCVISDEVGTAVSSIATITILSK